MRHVVNRCAIKGCPVVGHWCEGELCPMHADDPDLIAARKAEALAAEFGQE